MTGSARLGIASRFAQGLVTRSAAEFFGRLAEEGTVEVGKKANLVLLEANPLTDVANTRRVAAVVLRGRFISAEELQRHR